MKYLEPIVASVCFALLLLAGILALESNKGVFGPSAGAAVAMAALAAFFVVYDMMKREGAPVSARERSDKTTAKADVTPRIPASELEIVDAVNFDKSPGASMLSAIEGTERSTPAAFRITFPAPGSSKPNPYDGEHLLEQMKVLENHFQDGFAFVIFVRHNKQFLGFAKVADFTRLLTERESRRPLVTALNAGREEEFLKEPGIDDTVIESTLTNTKALQVLASRNKLAGMIVKPTNHRAIGIIDWATLVGRVVGARGP